MILENKWYNKVEYNEVEYNEDGGSPFFMRKLSLVLSYLIFLVFTIVFIYNLIVELDLFYIMWGAILLPVPISLLLYNELDKLKSLRLWNMASIIILVVISILYYYYPDADSFDSMPDPGPRLINFILYFVFGVTLLLSYLTLVSNYSAFSKRQIIQYFLIVPAFFFCLYSFDKYRILEYVSSILLFLIICYNYIEIAYRSIRKV